MTQAVLPFAGTIQERFEAYHAAHPEVYAHLLHLAVNLRRRGWKHYGIRTLWETMRHNFDVQRDEGEAYKLNDQYTSRYARLLMESTPELEGFFEVRELRAS